MVGAAFASVNSFDIWCQIPLYRVTGSAPPTLIGSYVEKNCSVHPARFLESSLSRVKTLLFGFPTNSSSWVRGWSVLLAVFYTKFESNVTATPHTTTPYTSC